MLLIRGDRISSNPIDFRIEVQLLLCQTASVVAFLPAFVARILNSIGSDPIFICLNIIFELATRLLSLEIPLIAW